MRLRQAPPREIGGYVLAGGRSSRMGFDKALLTLAGRPLVEHAVTRLRRVCRDVHILSGNAGLSRFAPTVGDLHQDCGPLGGIEAALAHTSHDWNLIVPVDVPFLPSALLYFWAGRVPSHAARGTRMAFFEVEGIRHPTVLMVHREVAPSLAASLAAGHCRLGPALQAAADQLEARRPLPAPWKALQIWGGQSGGSFEAGESNPPGPAWSVPAAAQQLFRKSWFANLNSPEDFAWAEKHEDALDT